MPYNRIIGLLWGVLFMGVYYMEEFAWPLLVLVSRRSAVVTYNAGGKGFLKYFIF